MGLARRERGIRQDRVLAPVDQSARDGGAPFRLSVRKETTVPWRRLVDEHVIGQGHGVAHDAAEADCSRKDLKDARISPTNNSGCSQAAKCVPLENLL